MRETVCRIIVCLSTVGLILSYGTPAAAANLREVGRAATGPVVDVALADGILRGQLLDGQGVPRSHVPVTVSSGERVVQRTATSEDGKFAVRLGQGGVYVVSAGDDSSVIRAWSQAAAPPSARNEVLLVSGQDVERGNLGSSGIFADPRARVGLAVAAVGGIATAVVLAVVDSGS